MYWVVEPMFGKFAERENETFVMALCVFSMKAAASEYLRHNPGVGRRTREVSGVSWLT
jgi:hypothetical protein